MITQTGGHGDFRLRAEIPRGPLTPLSAAEIAGISAIADGAPEMLRRSREQLLLGASQIKLMVGGGVSSQYDPLDVQQFTEDEIRAAVQAARDWGTYVAAHVYTSQGILRALDCGVLSIEHGQLADDRTAARIAEAGAWWSLQPFLADADANPQPTPEQQAQQREIAEGTVRAVDLARSTGSGPRSAPTSCSARAGPGRRAARSPSSPPSCRRPRRCARHQRQRRAAGAVGGAKPLPGQARGGGAGGDRRPDRPRRRPAGRDRPDRRSRAAHAADREGRRDRARRARRRRGAAR